MPNYRLLAYRGVGRHSKTAFDHIYDNQGKIQSEIVRLRNLTGNKRITSIYVNDKKVYG